MFRWVDHTAELELRVEASNEEGVFREALAALGELLQEHSDRSSGRPAAHEVNASAPDRPTLLAEWLNELVFLAESEQFIPETVEALSITEPKPRDLLANRALDLDATISGRQAAPPHLVKAVTYHRLDMKAHDGGWHATVVLDV
jgi:SHS2 domain-containing protein